MSFEVAIPSWRRPGVLADKSLPALLDGGIPGASIRVFVADDAERALYEDSVGARVAEIVVVGYDPTEAERETIGSRPLGRAVADNAIVDFYGPGVEVLSFDDDLTGLERMIDEKTTLPIVDLADYFAEMFATARRRDRYLWGVYPAPNPYFMRHRMKLDLRYIPGGCFGYRLRGEDVERVVLPTATDQEKSLRFYVRDGGLLRDDSVCMGTAGYHGRGGMVDYRTREMKRASLDWLLAEFPGLCSLNLSKKSGWPEIRLRDRRPVGASGASGSSPPG